MCIYKAVLHGDFQVLLPKLFVLIFCVTLQKQRKWW